MKREVLLEPQAEEVSNESMAQPRIYQMPPAKGRMVLEKIQSSPVEMFPAEITSMKVNTEKWGNIMVYIVVPPQTEDPANVIYYIHGAGWVFGSFHTHEKLVRELAARTGCIVVFPEYSRAPEARFPVAMNQCYYVMCHLQTILAAADCRMNPCTLTVAGDSAGGTLAIDMTLLAKYKKGPQIQKQLLFYPVTNACFDTESYCRFGEDYYLYKDGMKWFWNQYIRSRRTKSNILVSPLRASREQLCNLPMAMIINGEADVLRDEGEAYAVKLREACVPVTAVRIQAMIHDFVMLHSLDQTLACRAAMDLACGWIIRNNCCD